MPTIALYVATLVPFLALDAIWLRLVMRPLFEAEIGGMLRDPLRLDIAAAFYLLYIAGVVHFAGLPGWRADSLVQTFLNGAFLGLIAYGTYEITNFATLRGWTWTIVLTDMTWGTLLTGTSAVIGVVVVRAFGLAAR